MTSSHPRVAAIGLLLVAFLLAIAGPVAAQESETSPAPSPVGGSVSEANAQGAALVERFLTILSRADDEKRLELEAFLSAEFQLLRADGTRLTRDEYVANPASTAEWAVSGLLATEAEGVIVTTYLLDTTVTIDEITRTATAPRLSVFHESDDGEWRMSAHANFMPLEQEPAASPET
jgi:hypothetical protein